MVVDAARQRFAIVDHEPLSETLDSARFEQERFGAALRAFHIQLTNNFLQFIRKHTCVMLNKVFIRTELRVTRRRLPGNFASPQL